jgi:single-stranded DNA-binding protein
MALPELRGTGRLITDPRHGTTKTDQPYTSALIKFSTWRKVDGTWVEGEGTLASVIAFEDNATALNDFTKGDPIGVTGPARAAIWNDKPQIAVTITSCWTPEKTTKTATQAVSTTNA